MVEDALKESEERFKKLFMEAPMGVALIDSLTGHIYEVNPMFAKSGAGGDVLVYGWWVGATRGRHRPCHERLCLRVGY